jgi:hypothetical protein
MPQQSVQNQFSPRFNHELQGSFGFSLAYFPKTKDDDMLK